MNLNDHEKAILRKRWGLTADGKPDNAEPKYKGQSYTVFFPYNKEGLREFEPINLHTSVLKGSPHDRLQGTIPMLLNKKHIRPATLADFQDYRVCPKGHLI